MIHNVPIAMTTCRRNGRTLGMAARRPLRRRPEMNWKTWMLWGACAIALAADTGAELYQKALVKERGAGNLEEAIKLYQRVAKEFSSDLELAAKALVQAARGYDKFGDRKSVKRY